jgi:hypothetical protein
MGQKDNIKSLKAAIALGSLELLLPDPVLCIVVTAPDDAVTTAVHYYSFATVFYYTIASCYSYSTAPDPCPCHRADLVDDAEDTRSELLTLYFSYTLSRFSFHQLSA